METTTTTYSDELTDYDRNRLADLASSIQYKDTASPGIGRYEFYRRRGYAPAEAYSYAEAWCRNAVDQRSRRLAHDTGAEGWV